MVQHCHITITFIIFADLQYQSPLIRRLMRPRPGTGVRTMPEIIKRDRMSQIHTKNYQKYINTRQIHNFAKSIMRPKKLNKTNKYAFDKYKNAFGCGHKCIDYALDSGGGLIVKRCQLSHRPTDSIKKTTWNEYLILPIIAWPYGFVCYCVVLHSIDCYIIM